MRKKQKSADRRRGTVIVERLRRRRPRHRRRRRGPDPARTSGTTAKLDSVALDEIGAAGVGLPEGHHQEGRRQPAARAGRHAGRLHRRAAGVRRALEPGRPRAGVVRAEVLHRRRPPGARGAGAQPRARLHDPLVRRDHRRGQPTRWTRSRRSRRKFGDSNFRDKFIAAPWKSTDEDGAKFPDGQHVAFTHWSAGGNGETDTTKQVGAFQYCSGVSGAALHDVHGHVPLHRLARARRDVTPGGSARASGQVGAAGLLQRGHDLLDLLGARPGGDQQGVRGVDDDDVVEPDDGDDPAAAGHHQAGAVDARAPAPASPSTVTGDAGRRSSSVASASKSPMSSQWNDDGHDGDPAGVGGGLGDRVVERDLRQRRPQLVEPVRARRRSRAGSAANSGCQRPSRSSSTVGRTTNMPAFQR